MIVTKNEEFQQFKLNSKLNTLQWLFEKLLQANPIAATSLNRSYLTKVKNFSSLPAQEQDKIIESFQDALLQEIFKALHNHLFQEPTQLN